jgi:hypothetical protein
MDTTGRPKITWRKTAENELKVLKMTWGEAKKQAKNQTEWRNLVLTLCSTRSEEDRYVGDHTITHRDDI